MRSPLAVLIPIALLLATSAHAAAPVVLDDIAGDDGLWGGGAETNSLGLGTENGQLADCTSPAADLRQVTVASDGDVAIISLTVADFSLEVTCSLFSLGEGLATGGEFRVDLRDPAGIRDLTAMARTTGFGIDGCVEIFYADGGSDCIGTTQVDQAGSTITWVVPLHGTAVVDVTQVTDEEQRFDARAYDLSGQTFEADGEALVWFDAMTGIVTIFDPSDTSAPVTL